jgi:hypothetical protein
MLQIRSFVLACLFLVLAVVVPLTAASAGTRAHRSAKLDRVGVAMTTSQRPNAQKKPARAPAIRTVKSPPEPGLSLGISGAVTQLASGSSTSIASWDTKARNTSAQIVRINVAWSSIAPASPPAGFDAADPDSVGYNWSTVDQEVEDVTGAGFTPIIEVQGAPTWAEGPNIPAETPAGTWEPNATDFGEFATALATRYNGSTPGLPRVTYWQAWNEPNLNQYLNPQWTSSGSPASPGIYRGLENAFYASVKAVSSTNYVVAAGTAPYGDPDPGGARMQPVTFDQNLFCLTTSDQPAGGCPGPTYLDAIDDHPYVSALCCLGPTWHAALADDTSIPDMYKIVDIIKAAETAGTVAPSGTKGVWASELGWNTDPPNPDPKSASSPTQVARWATQALYILWSQGVTTVLWYSLADPAIEPAAGWDSTYEEGLYYGNGTAKPAAQAFRFPFMTNRRTKGRVEAWGRSPRLGTVWIQQEIHGKWESILQIKAKANQVFEAPLRLIGSASYRAVVSGVYSPTWAQSA